MCVCDNLQTIYLLLVSSQFTMQACVTKTNTQYRHAYWSQGVDTLLYTESINSQFV